MGIKRDVGASLNDDLLNVSIRMLYMVIDDCASEVVDAQEAWQLW